MSTDNTPLDDDDITTTPNGDDLRQAGLGEDSGRDVGGSGDQDPQDSADGVDSGNTGAQQGPMDSADGVDQGNTGTQQGPRDS